MSSGFLSAAERERWQRFPETIPQDDLASYPYNVTWVRRQNFPMQNRGFTVISDQGKWFFRLP
jgi:hypothetical protein